MSDAANNLDTMRHSAAHVLAAAMSHIYKDVKFGVGPAIENGFYYDFDLGDQVLSEADLAKIEQEMAAIISADQPFQKELMPINQAMEWAKVNAQPYKLELLSALKKSGTTDLRELELQELGVSTGKDIKEVSFYTNGDFKDLCRGPHLKSTGQIGPFKLTRVSGAYWRGDEHNKQLQRVYGVAFESQGQLESYLKNTAEAKTRDHRKLGPELDLFVISDLVGPGLPLFTPRGTTLRNELIKYSEELQTRRGYQAVWAPHIARTELYKRSGHLDKFPERFNVSSAESDDRFMLKPMNCPHVIQIYASRPRSYRELPLRYMETTTMYRDEKSGELHGLSRVRSLTQDDSHAFVRHDQIKDELQSVISMVKEMYQTLDMPLRAELSFRDDSDKYFGDKKLWAEAEQTMEDIAQEASLQYSIIRGEAAFYGPKIDIHISDALGRNWQCATIQLDFIMPERFDLTYITDHGDKKHPVIIHKAILGSIERFLSVYIEHTAGRFPIWLAPEQLRLISLNQTDEVVSYAQKMLQRALEYGLRATIDEDNQSVSKKIRQAEVLKIPYVLVIGQQEISSGLVKPRIRQDLADQPEAKSLSYEDFLASVLKDYQSRSLKSSL